MVLPVTTLGELFGAALIVPDVGRFAIAVTYERFGELDRGSYDIAPAEVPAALVQIAERVTHRSLAVGDARVLRFAPGDYRLAHHDPPFDGNPVEITLDLSEAPVPGAEVHYRRRGQVFFRFPSQPGAMAVVECGPTVTRNHTYVSRRQTASVVRLVARLVTRER
jgi:hypothetical protein